MPRCKYCGGITKGDFVYCSHDHALEDGAFDTKVCQECKREFNLRDEDEAQEWYYGHDCEAA